MLRVAGRAGRYGRRGAGALSTVNYQLSTASLSEADLSRLWEHQSFPAAALVTRDGQRLRVIYRGRRPGGPGPDFRGAIIAAPGTLLQGDVELHLRSSDFRRHGHDRDPAYDGVILHLVFQHDDDGTHTALPGGRRASVVALADWVEGRVREISSWLERPRLWREPCFGAVSRLGAAEVAARLDQMGDMRFRRKTAAFSKRLLLESADDLLWEALLEALGYGGEREAFLLLARRLPWQALRQRLVAVPAAERQAEAERLLVCAAGIGGVPPALSSLRPANRAAVRLPGTARLASRFAAGGGILNTIQRLLAGVERTGNRNLSAQLSPLFAILTVPGAIGRSRAVELLANALLPCLAALGPPELTRRAEELYRGLILPAHYGAVRHLHQAVATDVRINARRQQGMLYLLKQYCTQGGCGSCPLS